LIAARQVAAKRYFLKISYARLAAAQANIRNKRA